MTTVSCVLLILNMHRYVAYTATTLVKVLTLKKKGKNLFILSHFLCLNLGSKTKLLGSNTQCCNKGSFQFSVKIELSKLVSISVTTIPTCLAPLL